MWWFKAAVFLRGGAAGYGGGGSISSLFPATTSTSSSFSVVRHFCRKTAPNLRKINPKVPPQEASQIAESLYNVIKQQGPVNIASAWTHAQEASIIGLSSKTHLKIMLKWMQGRKMLKQYCNLVGTSKRFFLCTLPEDPNIRLERVSTVQKQRSRKPAFKKKKSKK